MPHTGQAPPETESARQADLGSIVCSPDGEEWVEFGPGGARRRVGFHDYAEIYAVPGPGTDDPEGLESGFPDVMGALLADSELLAQESFVHRVRPDGSDDLAVAFVGRLRR